ncbi:hypothetical protein PROFUN_12734 [Planoprotostelium fungivorum]|uniref:F-box/LRR-repeat protein 15-like leucin rich repeat domain-containing protein n=1 Tax=Planoprotostelium fungivorum TaxID=1890364 RepID=A0A2P6N8H9_9EUKA|nr:hypothetical protein PROFUN_12734 [Planoprotostelium fungivorum]
MSIQALHAAALTRGDAFRVYIPQLNRIIIKFTRFHQLPESLLQNVLDYSISRHLFSDELSELFLHEYIEEIDFSRANSIGRYVQSINLDRCYALTEAELLHFFSPDHLWLKQLKKVNLTSVHGVTDEVIGENSSHVSMHSPSTRMLRQNPELRELSVFGCSKLTDRFLLEISESCTNVNILSVARLPLITDDGLTSVIRSCHLTELNLGRSLRELAGRSGDLRYIDLTQLNAVDTASLVQLFSSAENLETCYLSCTSNVDREVLTSIANTCHEMKKLYVSRQDFVIDESVVSIAQNCPQLEILNLSRCSKVTDESMTAVADGCPSLNTLYMSLCSLVTNNGLSDVFEKCSNLTILELNGCRESVNASSLSVLARCCPKIQLLDLTGCLNVDAECISIISSSFPFMVHLALADTNIEDSDVEVLSKGIWKRTLDTIVLSGCTNLRGDSVASILQNLEQLGRAYFSHCVCIHNVEKMQQRERRGGLRTMEGLFFSRCINMSDHMLLESLKECSNLTTLVLSECNRLTDASTSLIPTMCPHLQLLDLAFVDSITDATIEAIAKKCNKLTTFTATNCVLITDASVSLLIQNCKMLSSLILSGCERITMESVKHARASHRLEVLSVTGTAIPKEKAKSFATENGMNSQIESYNNEMKQARKQQMEEQKRLLEERRQRRQEQQRLEQQQRQERQRQEQERQEEEERQRQEEEGKREESDGKNEEE